MLLGKDQSGLKLVSLTSIVYKRWTGTATFFYQCRLETQTFGLEPSLADLHQRALFLPRSTLRNLVEIGQG